MHKQEQLYPSDLIIFFANLSNDKKYIYKTIGLFQKKYFSFKDETIGIIQFQSYVKESHILIKKINLKLKSPSKTSQHKN